MTEENIYQNALAHAIEEAANSQIAVREHLNRLAFMKSERVFNDCIGKEFESEDLKGIVKAIAVGYETKDDVFKLARYNNTDNAIQIKVVFAVDVQSLIDSKRKQLTQAERKDLKEIRIMREDADCCRKNPWYGSYNSYRSCKVETFQRIQSDFENRKNALKVLEIATWSYNLSQVLADDFIRRGLTYDHQTICSTLDK